MSPSHLRQKLAEIRDNPCDPRPRTDYFGVRVLSGQSMSFSGQEIAYTEFGPCRLCGRSHVVLTWEGLEALQKEPA